MDFWVSVYAHNWFLSSLALNETRTSHTTWRYSDQIAVLSGGTISFPFARHVILYLVLVQTRKHPDMTENFLTGMGRSRGGGGGGQGSGPPTERSQK